MTHFKYIKVKGTTFTTYKAFLSLPGDADSTRGRYLGALSRELNEDGSMQWVIHLVGYSHSLYAASLNEAKEAVEMEVVRPYLRQNKPKKATMDNKPL